jgi:hypothetical protein
MRLRVRSRGVKGVLVLLVVVAAGALAATTFGSHGQQRWSGQWDFEHLDPAGAPNGVTGGFAFRHETDEGGATLLSQIGGTPCPEPTDYFAGGYTVPDGTPPSGPPPGEFVDTGRIRGCTVGNSPDHLKGRYESNGSGGSGNIDLTLTSPTTWTGTFTVDGQSGVFQWRGRFDKHFEDGADDVSTPPYSSNTPADEPDPAGPPVPAGTEDEPAPAEQPVGECSKGGALRLTSTRKEAGPNARFQIVARSNGSLPDYCHIRIDSSSLDFHDCHSGQTVCQSVAVAPLGTPGKTVRVRYFAQVYSPDQGAVPGTGSNTITVKWQFPDVPACAEPDRWTVTLAVSKRSVAVDKYVAVTVKANGCMHGTGYVIRVVEDGKRNVMLCNWSSSCKDALISKTAKTASYRAIVSKGGRGRAVASSAPVTIEWTASSG